VHLRATLNRAAGVNSHKWQDQPVQKVFICTLMYKYIHEKVQSCPGDAAGLDLAVSRTAPRTPTGYTFGHGRGGLVPVTLNVPIPAADPYTLFSALGIDEGFLLESMEGMPRRAVRSIIGLEPALVLSMDGELSCTGRPGLADFLGEVTGSPVAQLREIAGRLSCRGVPGHTFLGGLVGYCTYDMVTGLTNGMVQAGRKKGPLARFMLSTRGVVYNHVSGACLLYDDLVLLPGDDPDEERAKARERLGSLSARIQEIAPGPEDHGPAPGPAGENEEYSPASTSVSRDEFMEAVRRAKDHIRAGDIFQVVLSREVTCPCTGDPLAIYRAIRRINPSPYLYYLGFDDEAIIGSSPEMLVRVEERKVQTVPIAGTRPRGKDPVEDARLAQDLLGDEKEKAEHLMLVDLARNDIGRVSAFGSVEVPEFMEVEQFSHVQHLVSRVSGVMAGDRDRFDALAACFPAGTVSGAPKIRAMQIIAELEPRPRGLYAGAVGYVGFNECLEFAIAIRTLRVSGGLAEFSTGAGIVADSVPEREWEETGHKARAMVQAVAQGGRNP